MIGVVLDEGDKEKLKFLHDDYLGPRTSSKRTYVSWNRYSKSKKGKVVIII